MFKKLIAPVCLIVIFISATAGVWAAPRLVITDAEFDFGFAPQKSKITHNFWLKAAGEENLKITKVIPGCGCTQAPLEKSEIVPGDSSRLEIIFSTRTYRNNVTKSPRIQSNEGPPDKRVKILANVVAIADSTYPLVFNPFKVNLTSFGSKQRDEIKFEISNVSDEEIKLTLIDYPIDVLKIELPDSIKAGKKKYGKIKVLDAEVNTDFEKSFTIELNDEKNTRFTVPVVRNSHVIGKR